MSERETAINTVKAYVKACNERNIFFNKIILFGSYVTGKNHQYSDIDVALVSDSFSDDAFADWRSLVPVNIKFVDVEPHPFPTKYFEEGDPFIDEIKKTGIEISL